LAVSLPNVAISKVDQSILISAVIAALGVVGWEEAKGGRPWSGPEMAQRERQEMKGPTVAQFRENRPQQLVTLSQTPVPAYSAYPALFSISVTLIWQEGVSQEGPQMSSCPGIKSPPGAG
jgi:hypothetical protein